MWLDSPADCPTAPKAVTDCYDSSAGTGYCQVWGGWDEKVKAKLGAQLPGIRMGLVKDMRGFIKDPFKEGFATGVAPMIWISKRNVKPGRMASCGKHFQLGTDLMFPNAPAARTMRSQAP